MRNILYCLATAMALTSTAALAGSPADPVVEPPIIIEDTTSSSSGAQATVALLALLMSIPALD